MSASPRARTRGDPLVEAALRRLIDEHGQSLLIGELPWLGWIYGQVRQGFPLRDDRVARVSRIRAELAQQHHHRAGRAQHYWRSPDWDGAA